MSKSSYDKLGRRNRVVPISTGKRIKLQPRDRMWFSKLLEHGPLPSSYLLAYAKRSHRNAKRASERLTDLFNEETTDHDCPYLRRPPQQFQTLDSRYNQLVYDLTSAANRALADEREDSKFAARRMAGPWLHAHMVACITASIELATLDDPNINYLPQSYLLQRAGAALDCPTPVIDPHTGRTVTKRLIPDALFGLRYETRAGAQYRCFVVEADRSTEPGTSQNFNRKSWHRNLLQYEAYIGSGLYRDHLKLKAPLLLLIVCTDERKVAQIQKLVARYTPSIAPVVLFQTWSAFGGVYRPPQPNPGLLIKEWARLELGALRLDERQ